MWNQDECLWSKHISVQKKYMSSSGSTKLESTKPLCQGDRLNDCFVHANPNLEAFIPAFRATGNVLDSETT